MQTVKHRKAIKTILETIIYQQKICKLFFKCPDAQTKHFDTKGKNPNTLLSLFCVGYGACPDGVLYIQ